MQVLPVCPLKQRCRTPPLKGSSWFFPILYFWGVIERIVRTLKEINALLQKKNNNYPFYYTHWGQGRKWSAEGLGGPGTVPAIPLLGNCPRHQSPSLCCLRSIPAKVRKHGASGEWEMELQENSESHSKECLPGVSAKA